MKSSKKDEHLQSKKLFRVALFSYVCTLSLIKVKTSTCPKLLTTSFLLYSP